MLSIVALYQIIVDIIVCTALACIVAGWLAGLSGPSQVVVHHHHCTPQPSSVQRRLFALPQFCHVVVIFAGRVKPKMHLAQNDEVVELGEDENYHILFYTSVYDVPEAIFLLHESEVEAKGHIDEDLMYALLDEYWDELPGDVVIKY